MKYGELKKYILYEPRLIVEKPRLLYRKTAFGSPTRI
jgi:hypothetical protein